MTKRGFSTKEAMEYLGVHRRFFTTTLMPMLKGKGTRAGTSIIYEKQDLDDAWERYKLSLGSERASSEGDLIWHVQEDSAASTRARTARGKSTASSASSEFANVVSRITGRRKNS